MPTNLFNIQRSLCQHLINSRISINTENKRHLQCEKAIAVGSISAQIYILGTSNQKMFFKLLVCLLGCGLCYGASSPSLTSFLSCPDIQWTKAINAKLCEPGAHPDAVAAQFFACYNENITPGGNTFLTCMTSVYGVKMDTEAHIDTVCNASSDKFPRYAACIFTGLLNPFNGGIVLPSTAIHKLNQCQGGVMGVAPPA